MKVIIPVEQPSGCLFIKGYISLIAFKQDEAYYPRRTAFRLFFY